jgi:hypothetical protein
MKRSNRSNRKQIRKTKALERQEKEKKVREKKVRENYLKYYLLQHIFED